MIFKQIFQGQYITYTSYKISMFNLYNTFQLFPQVLKDFKTLGTSHSAQHHIPGDLNPQQKKKMVTLNLKYMAMVLCILVANNNYGPTDIL
jgi:hypothetical protein